MSILFVLPITPSHASSHVPVPAWREGSLAASKAERRGARVDRLRAPRGGRRGRKEKKRERKESEGNLVGDGKLRGSKGSDRVERRGGNGGQELAFNFAVLIIF